MDIILGTTDFKLEKPTAVAIGKFDGVHLGHRRLIEEIVAQKKRGLQSCVFTFWPAPSVLFGRSDGKELTTRAEKRCLFEQMGVDILIEFPMTPQTAQMTGERFVREILCDQMGMAFLAAGRDVSFGAKGAGDYALLQALAPKLGFVVKVIDKVTAADRVVSSTYIRELVEMGNMEQAGQLLGMPYTISGEVVHGNKIGRTLHFPTVNIVPPAGKLLPPNGVYFSELIHAGHVYKGISNVGTKPTVADKQVMGVETFLYDFQQELYGASVTVRLLAFHRPEQRFDGLSALQHQLQQDTVRGMEWHRSRTGCKG